MSVKLSQTDLRELCVAAGVSARQADAMAAKARPQDLQCFLNAILYYFQSGDLWGAAVRMLDCLMKGGVAAAVNPLLCLLTFLREMRAGADAVMALFRLLACVLGVELPDPDPPDPDPSIDPPSYRPVNRCG